MTAPVRTLIETRLTRAAERRRLADADRRGAMLGRLTGVETVLRQAEQVVAGGWVQCAWYASDGGAPGACLVGAIVRAAGGDRHAERTQKAVAVAWSTLLGRDDDPDSCTAPAVRTARIRELTAWNDAPERTSAEVRALLIASAARVAAARRRVQGSAVPA